MTFGPAHVWVLPPDLTAAAQARRHVTTSCAGLPDDTVHTVRLLASELVANAVLHGRGTVLLTLARDGSRVRVEVHDESSRQPVLADRSLLSDHGAGLHLVAALASRWGSGARDDGRPGKRVWFELD